MYILTKAMPIIKKVIKGRPTVHYYMQKYRGEDIWQKNNNYTDESKVKYITYLHNELHKHYINANIARESFLKEF